MKAFITLLSTEDYLDAVLILNMSLRDANSKYPLVCGVVESLKENNHIINSLNQAGIKIEFIKELTYNQEVINKWQGYSVLNTASKISLFDLKHYEKLVYIDADVIVMENIDDVMNYPDGAMIEPAPKEKQDNYGFTGLFVFQPKYHREDFYKCLIQNFPCADGDMIGSLWFFTRTSPAHRIPYSYCTHYAYYYCEDYPAKVVHFCNEQKPWKRQWFDYFRDRRDPVIQKYRKYLNILHPENKVEGNTCYTSLCSSAYFSH